MDRALELVRKERANNKLKREIEENDRQIRDNRIRIELLSNLRDYITPTMTYEDILDVVRNMRSDYEDRVDDYIIKNAEFGKERREIKKVIREIEKSIKTVKVGE